MRPPIHPVFPPKMSTFVIGVGSDMITVVSGKYGASGRGGGAMDQPRGFFMNCRRQVYLFVHVPILHST